MEYITVEMVTTAVNRTVSAPEFLLRKSRISDVVIGRHGTHNVEVQRLPKAVRCNAGLEVLVN